MTNESVPRANSELREEADAWWLRLRSGAVTRDDATAFQRWRSQSAEHLRAWDEVTRVWQTLQPVAAQAAQRDPAVMRMPAGKARFLRSPERRAFFGAAVAASVTGMLIVRPPFGMWSSYADLAADYHTGTGEQRQVAIDDRITVRMNTQTRINRRDSGDSSGSAIELMTGEAEVEASAASAPATLFAANGQVQATTARFNVRYTGPQVCVTCLAGSVDVRQSGRTQSLLEGQQVVYDERGMRSATAATPETNAWRRGALVFANIPLSEVVAEINRYRVGWLVVRGEALAERRVHMRIPIQQVDDAPAMIGRLYAAKLTNLPAGIVLLS